jgi:hypothetical protein
MKEATVNLFRTEVEKFVAAHAPKGHGNINYYEGTNFSMGWRNLGHGQDVTLDFTDRQFFINWPSTQRTITNAAAFLAHAKLVVDFAARADVWFEQTLQTLDKLDKK